MNEKSYKPLEPVAGLQFLRNTELGVLKALQNNRYKITPIDTLHRHDCDLYERWFPKTIDSLIPLGLVRKRYFSSGEYTTTVEGNKKAIEGIFFYLNQINSFGGLSMSERSAIVRVKDFVHLTTPFSQSDVTSMLGTVGANSFKNVTRTMVEKGILLQTIKPGTATLRIYLVTQKARNAVLAWTKITEIIQKAQQEAEPFVCHRDGKFTGKTLSITR